MILIGQAVDQNSSIVSRYSNIGFRIIMSYYMFLGTIDTFRVAVEKNKMISIIINVGQDSDMTEFSIKMVKCIAD